MKEYSYSILSIFTQQSVNGLTNVVKYVDWRYQVKEEEAVGEKYYRTEMLPPNEVSFTSYNDLTSDIVWGWITSIVDIEQIKLEVDELFENIKNPENIVEKPIPWVIEYEKQYDPQNDLYVLTKNDEIRFGPTFYEHFRFNEHLQLLGLPETMVQDFIARRQGILPTTQPLIIDAETNVKMYKAVYQNSLLATVESLFYENNVCVWDLTSGVAVGTYTHKMRSLEEIRNAFTQLYMEKKLEFLELREWKIIDGENEIVTDLQGVENDCISIVNRMRVYQDLDPNTTFKIRGKDSNILITVTYAQVCEFVMQYNNIIQLADDYLAERINEVYACNTVDEFKLLPLDYWNLQGN